MCWRVFFGVPLEVVEYSQALFELHAFGGLAIALPAPDRRLPPSEHVAEALEHAAARPAPAPAPARRDAGDRARSLRRLERPDRGECRRGGPPLDNPGRAGNGSARKDG